MESRIIRKIFLDFFAENVVYLGIFSISGLIPKISVLLNSVLKIFGIQ